MHIITSHLNDIKLLTGFNLSASSAFFTAESLYEFLIFSGKRYSNAKAEK